MKNIYLLFSLFIIFISCQKDEVETLPEQNNFQEKPLQQIEFGQLPESILKNFDDKNFIKGKVFKQNNFFGPARTDVPAVKIINKSGKVSYTLILGKAGNYKSSSLYFDNLVVQELRDGSQREYVFRYRPEEGWY